MVTIQKRIVKGKTVYRVLVRRRGYPVQSATFQKLTDARKWAQVTEVAINEGRYFKPAEAKRHTVAELIDRYVRNVLPDKKPSTVAAQQRHFRWWKQRLGDYALADITTALLAERRDELALNFSNSTTNRYMAALSHAFTIAVKEWEWLDDNPCQKVRKLREPRGRVRYLSDDERECLLAACKASRNPYLYLVVVLALSTGARKMELLSLSWNDVDLQQGMIHLQHTKNGDRRTLPLTGHALVLMLHHISTCRADSSLVFPNLSGKQPLEIRDA